MSEIDAWTEGKKKASECHRDQCENNAATAIKNASGRQKQCNRAEVELPFRLPEAVCSTTPELSYGTPPPKMRRGRNNVVR